MEPDRRPGSRRRARSALGLALLPLAALLLVFFQEQVVHGPMDAVAQGGRVRAHVVPAPRGLLVDRHGAVLAATVPGYAISLPPAPTDSVRRALQRLAPVLDLSTEDLEALLARHRSAPGQRLLVRPDIPFDVVARLVERRAELGDVEIHEWAKRHYPAGSSVAHVVGMVGPVADSAPGFRPFSGHHSGGLVGTAGVERRYDQRLTGRPGLKYTEMDGRGRAVRPVQLRREVNAVAGETLRLTLDLGLQEIVARALPASARAAVVALDPASGGGLVLYSSPSFDPNQVSGPEFHERWAELLDAQGEPALSRAVAGTYPPGSAWGMTTALTALRLQVADAETRMPMMCRGGLRYGGRFLPCSDRSGHGLLTLREALAERCHVYLYQLGLKVGLERLLAEGARFGFDRPTGVDLFEERAGSVPTDLAAYSRMLGVEPGEHEAMLVAAGQGLIEVSPLKIAHFFAALTAGAPVPAPRLLADGEATGDALDLELTLAERAWLRRELHVRREPGGGVDRSDRAGRAGRADRAGRAVGTVRSSGVVQDWFVGSAERPADGSRLVVAVVVEGSDAGVSPAAVGNLVLDRFLARE
jgi:penicillin-binding protein 2